MKDSGIEWIGQIPKDWKTIKLKNIYSDSCAGEVIDKSYWNEGNELLYTCQKTPMLSSFNAFPIPKRTKKNDLLLTRNATPYIFIPKNNSIYSNVVQRITIPNNYDNRFVRYSLMCGVDSLTVQGDTIPSYNMQVWNNIIIPDIPLYFQQHIADFLDDKCGKIDRYIEKQQQIIEKLKAYKQSVITEAVTKGLDPNVAMKDSGIDWIGMIPEHWKLSHIGNLAEIGSGGTPDRNKPQYWEDGHILWMSSGEINYEYVYDTAEKITELGVQNSNAKVLPINTVMLGLIGQGKTKGMTAILKVESTCNQNLAYLITNPSFLHYEYLFYCFKAMYNYIRGLVGESQAGIYQYFLKKQSIPLPNVEEQKVTSQKLNKICIDMDVTIAKIQLLIDKLTGYKKSLIYEAVTGKLEII